tara:strand:+ start:2458 stop:3378 length:921 start_codon:yes stop_codon:yes gene_type:complete
MFSANNIFFVLSTTLSITWSIPLLLLHIFDYQLYYIKKKKNVVLITKRLKNCISSITDDDLNPSGIVIGRWFIAYYIDYFENSHSGSIKELYLICSNKQYKLLSKNINEINEYDDDNKKKGITVWERSGTFYHLSYSNRSLQIKPYEEFEYQTDILTAVKKEYNAIHNCVAFINGKPGIGKSMIPLFLANELNCTYCNSWNPTDPSDDLSILYNSILPSEDEPLVLVLEEIDVILNDIHKGIPNHKNIPIPVRNKITWNTLLDKISIGLYPYLILFLISNKSANDLSNLDKSYLRDGRVNYKKEIK